MSEEFSIDMTPETAMLRSSHAQGIPAKIIFAELIDNSFDADAASVRIEFEKNKIIVSDDGRGCDDISRMLKSGSHNPHPTTRSGMYGVGLKDAATALWGTLAIETSTTHGTSKARVNWSVLEQSGDWSSVKGSREPNESGKSGTRLTFQNPTKKIDSYDALSAELGWLFFPALNSGRQIQVATPRKPLFVVSPWRMPILSESIEDAFSIDGRDVHLRAGIVQAGQDNPKKGFTYCYGHRALSNSVAGCGHYASAHICGVVMLGKGWKPSKNKTGIIEGEEELKDAIFVRCEHLLQKAESQSMEIRNDAFTQSLADAVNSSMGTSGKRGTARRPGNAGNEGTVPTKGTERRTRQASRVSGKGDVAQKGAEEYSRRGWDLEWESAPGQPPGRVDIPGRRFFLNSSHDLSEKLRADENIDAMTLMCEFIFAVEFIDTQQKEKFPGMRDCNGVMDVVCLLSKNKTTIE